MKLTNEQLLNALIDLMTLLSKTSQCRHFSDVPSAVNREFVAGLKDIAESLQNSAKTGE